MEKATVYFTKEITPQSIVRMYEKLGISLKGKVAVKLHSGEKGNQNYLRPEMVKEIVEKVGGTVVECNTAYEGARNTTQKHKQLMEEHEWTKYFEVDILDEEKEIELEIPNGKVIQKNYVGEHLENYDAILVLSHFKGHPMGGYGGALKQLSIGLASTYGKAYIHGAGKPEQMWSTEQDLFLESMADAASSIVEKFKGKIVYINIMSNMSVDCDCCAVAEDPCMKDIGILASLDPIAIDQACIDLVYQAEDEGKNHLIERIESRHGIHTIEVAEKLGFGTREYTLVEVKE